MADDGSLNKLSRCGICLEQYTKQRRAPVACPCGHSYCRLCVAQITKGRVINCPLCREVTSFGFQQLGRNIGLIDLLEHFHLLAEDDINDPMPKESTYDYTDVSDQELDALDFTLVLPYSEFVLNVARLTLRNVIERNQMESQANYYEYDPNLSQLQSRTSVEWHSFESQLSHLLSNQKSLMKVLTEWQNKMAEAAANRLPIPNPNLGNIFDFPFNVDDIDGSIMVYPSNDEGVSIFHPAPQQAVNQFTPPDWTASSRLWISVDPSGEEERRAAFLRESTQHPGRVATANQSAQQPGRRATGYARRSDVFGGRR